MTFESSMQIQETSRFSHFKAVTVLNQISHQNYILNSIPFAACAMINSVPQPIQAQSACICTYCS